MVQKPMAAASRALGRFFWAPSSGFTGVTVTMQVSTINAWNTQLTLGGMPTTCVGGSGNFYWMAKITYMGNP